MNNDKRTIQTAKNKESSWQNLKKIGDTLMIRNAIKLMKRNI